MTKWAVVQFKDEDQSISTVPYSWLVINENHTMCHWPNMKPRKYISMGSEPNPSWKLYELLKILMECEDYEEALSFEKEKELESSGSDIDRALSRSGRKTKKRFNEDFEYVGYDKIIDSPPQLNDKDIDISEADTDSLDEDEGLMPPPIMPLKRIKKSRPISTNKNEIIFGTEIIIQQEIIETHENVNQDNRLTNNDKQENCAIHNIDTQIYNQTDEVNESDGDKENTMESSNHEVCCKHAGILDKIFENGIAIKVMLNEQQKTIENILISNNERSRHVNNFNSTPVKPFKKYEKLLVYEENVKKSEETKIQLETLFYMCGGSDSKESIRRGLGKIFSDNLARKCSLTGRKGNYPIKHLTILSLLKDANRKRFGNMSEKDFEMYTSSWLRQSQLRYDRKTLNKSKEPTLTG